MIDMEIIMNNTYGVLTNRVSVEEILEQYIDGKLDTLSDAMFYGNPHEMTIEDINEVIEFFENTEEYEKCQELLHVRSDIMANGLTNKK
tara:strand:+ start:677 stop:943 length:267 start_codon:yes stop_codon:yes gene_type:complete